MNTSSTLLACLTLTLPSIFTVAAQEKPNVLFLAIDDMRTWVGCMNDDYPGNIHTPNIDALAKQGRLFTNAHVPAPMCGPCRASLLTGQLPSRLGIYSNHQWVRPNLPELVTLPKHFKTPFHPSQIPLVWGQV